MCRVHAGDCAVPAGPSDFAAKLICLSVRILSERGELVKAWFEAGTLPRKNAKSMQKRFDALTGEIDAKLDARRGAERARRRALIDQASATAERPADGASMAAMIALQKQWQEGMKGAIRLKAKEDQALWEEFRAGGSALFGKRDAEKASRNAERDALVADRRKVIDEIQALAAGSDAAALKRGIDELSARWHAMEWPERKPLRESCYRPREDFPSPCYRPCYRPFKARRRGGCPSP